MTKIDSITYGYGDSVTVHMNNGVSLPEQIVGLLADTHAAHGETYDASTFIEAAWNAAYPVPEGVSIPARKAFMEKFSDGEIHYVAQGSTTPYAVQSCDSMRYRTLTPLPEPEPEPWETAEFCYAGGMFFERGEEQDGTYWIGGDCCPQRYERDDMMKLNPRPVAIK